MQDRARQELNTDLKSSDEIYRAHALEVVKNAKLRDAGPILLVALNDQSLFVKAATASNQSTALFSVISALVGGSN